jgi:hypothetical protein
MSLATACLAVRKHGTIVAFDNIFNQTESAFVIYFLLFRVVAVNHVKSKCARLFIRLLGVAQVHLG